MEEMRNHFFLGLQPINIEKTMTLKSKMLAITSIQHQTSVKKKILKNKILVSQRLSFGHIYPTSPKFHPVPWPPSQNNPSVESAPKFLSCTLTLFKSIFEGSLEVKLLTIWTDEAK